MLRLQAAAVAAGLARMQPGSDAAAATVAGAGLRTALEDAAAAVPHSRAWPLGMVQRTVALLAQPLPGAADVGVKLALVVLGREVELRRAAARWQQALAGAGGSGSAASVGRASATDADEPGAADDVAALAMDAWALAPRYSTDRLALLGRVSALVTADATRGGAFPYTTVDDLVVAAYNDGWSLLQLHMTAPAERFIAWAVSMLEPLASLARAALGADARADALRLECTALREASRIAALAAEAAAAGGGGGGGSGARAWAPWAPAIGHAAAAPLVAPPPPPAPQAPSLTLPALGDPPVDDIGGGVDDGGGGGGMTPVPSSCAAAVASAVAGSKRGRAAFEGRTGVGGGDGVMAGVVSVH